MNMERVKSELTPHYYYEEIAIPRDEAIPLLRDRQSFLSQWAGERRRLSLLSAMGSYDPSAVPMCQGNHARS